MMTPGWWAMALCEAVKDQVPLAVAFAGEELVLFRNAAGQAFALEDRCPHRRVPLALGRVVESGLQCGYHGWTFDGASGGCTQIPNLHTDERVPARYAARAFAVSEANGFVHVWLGEGAPQGQLPSSDYQPGGREFTGSTIVNMKMVASVTRDEVGRGSLRLKTRPETLAVSQPFMALFRNM